MTDFHQENINAVKDAVLKSDAVLKPEFRQAVEARVAEHAGVMRPVEALLPDDIISYVDKVALNAYKITDEDIENLKEQGYSEDEIFELTVSAAFGAGFVRIERCLNLLGAV